MLFNVLLDHENLKKENRTIDNEHKEDRSLCIVNCLKIREHKIQYKRI